jgi:DUF1680 family protein
VTDEKRYLNLSKYFIDERGNRPHYYDKEAEERGDTNEYWPLYGYRYNQSHLPVREQTTAEGHSVRALYLYAGMADVAAETGDQSLIDACKTLWNNVTQKRMYITGGIGSSGYAEAFTMDYDLPNDTAYTETCASIGLVFFASRMLQRETSSGYAVVRREWSDGDTVALCLAMPVARVYSHPEIRMNSGKVALQRGPIIYCVEEADNGENIPSIVLDGDAEFSTRYDDTLLGGVTVIEGKAHRELNDTGQNELYSTEKPGKTEMTLTAIPYCVWNNRGAGEMQVWIRER